MIKFIKRNNVIPVDFGEFKLEFVANDDSLLMMSKLGDELKEKSKSLISESDEENLNTLKETLRDAWDKMFGPGTFDKVYEFSGQSSINSLVYFLETVKGIGEEYNNQTQENVLSRYIEN